MKPLSQQIRDLVSQSATSSYAIARAAEISKSAMSRFMNGGNLTMDKLDKLAEVLGVIVTSEVSFVPLPLVKGRPKKLEKITMNKKKASETANQVANQAADKHFSSRRGILHIRDIDCLAYFNNNPYDDPALRPRELSYLETELKKIGIKVIGRGASEDDYTVCLLLNCSVDRQTEVGEISVAAAEWMWDEIVNSENWRNGLKK